MVLSRHQTNLPHIAGDHTVDNHLDGIIIIIQFNSILYFFLCAESTATRPITDTAQHRNIIIIIIIIKYNNSP
jgi:hypothetical protein